MKIGNTTKFCKKHKKETLHAIYQFGDNKVTRCLDCAKEQKKERYKNPEKREHDLNYTKKWLVNNPEYAKNIAKNLAKKRYDTILSNVNSFINLYASEINQFLLQIKSNLNLDIIKKYCLKHNIQDIEKIKNYIISNKKSKLYMAYGWQQSSLLKYHLGVREIYEYLDESIKEEIRTYSKEIALNKTNKIIETLLK